MYFADFTNGLACSEELRDFFADVCDRGGEYSLVIMPTKFIRDADGLRVDGLDLSQTLAALDSYCRGNNSEICNLAIEDIYGNRLMGIESEEPQFGSHADPDFKKACLRTINDNENRPIVSVRLANLGEGRRMIVDDRLLTETARERQLAKWDSEFGTEWIGIDRQYVMETSLYGRSHVSAYGDDFGYAAMCAALEEDDWQLDGMNDWVSSASGLCLTDELDHFGVDPEIYRYYDACCEDFSDDEIEEALADYEDSLQ